MANEVHSVIGTRMTYHYVLMPVDFAQRYVFLRRPRLL